MPPIFYLRGEKMNPVIVLAAGAAIGMLAENPEKRRQVFTMVQKANQSLKGVVREVIPKNDVSTTDETDTMQTEQ